MRTFRKWSTYCPYCMNILHFITFYNLISSAEGVNKFFWILFFGPQSQSSLLRFNLFTTDSENINPIIQFSISLTIDFHPFDLPSKQTTIRLFPIRLIDLPAAAANESRPSGKLSIGHRNSIQMRISMNCITSTHPLNIVPSSRKTVNVVFLRWVR